MTAVIPRPRAPILYGVSIDKVICVYVADFKASGHQTGMLQQCRTAMPCRWLICPVGVWQQAAAFFAGTYLLSLFRACHASASVRWWLLLRGFPVSGLMVFHGGGHLRPSASIDASTNNVASRASIRHRHRLGRDGETGRPTHVALVQRVPSAPASASSRNRSALVAGPGILPGVDEPYGLQHASPWVQVGLWLWLMHA